ncbi:hypothetical protein FSARC_14066 [Fusarium sarcochroum]|uniref:Isochorismatase-like domain-containing protein n=1 Tax=Fusarium sarcochroum TaxID=1208366 RepID=A0A8H4WRA4_9HYPO|nr:hypothetical protein FSARC_14066 [Fusarium sarcochroum]
MTIPSSALFVIDIQKDLVGDPKTQIPHAERIRRAGGDILRIARSISTDPKPLLVFVQHEEAPESGPLVRGTEPWQLCFENDPNNARELLVSKNQRDTFKSNPRLADQLRFEGVEHIVAFGIQSECCVVSTCKGALETGFRVTLLQGAHSTYDTKSKTALQIEQEVEDELKALGASIVSWESTIANWRDTGGLS